MCLETGHRSFESGDSTHKLISLSQENKRLVDIEGSIYDDDLACKEEVF